MSSRVFYLSLAAFLGVYLIDSCLSDINLAFAASYIVNADTDTTADNQKPPLPPLPPCNSINCSFGEAIGAANANPGKDSILFGIPFVKPDSSPFISDPIVIDGGGDTVLDGSNCLSCSGGIMIGTETGDASNSIVTGLVIQKWNAMGIWIDSSSNTIQSNTITENPSGGIHIVSSNNNTVQGNHIGTDTSSSVGIGNGRYGINIYTDSKNNLIGGSLVGERNVISGNELSGIEMSFSSYNTIQSNTIIKNRVGITIFSSNNNTVQGNHIGY